MHREVTTAYSQADARALYRDGWHALKAKDQAIITGPDRRVTKNYFGVTKDGFSALMVRDITEDIDMTKRKDHHPHYAGHRHGGTAVGENAKRSGPQPGQTEFSADQEKAMRGGGAPSMDPSMDPSMGASPAPAPAGPAPQGPPPAVNGSPVPPNLDSDGGI